MWGALMGLAIAGQKGFNRSLTNAKTTQHLFVVQSRNYCADNLDPMLPAIRNGVFTGSIEHGFSGMYSWIEGLGNGDGTFGQEITFDTSITVHDDHPLSEYISTNLKGCDDPSKDSEFNVCFLGTGGGNPTRERICSSTLLRVKGQCFLFDVGEGVQRQLTFTRTQAKSITQIFITHMHGDHIFGLPGLLLHLNTVATAKYRQKQEPFAVELYGPPGLYNYIAMTMTLSMTASTAVSIVVHEALGK
jgi:hypothetical protein